MTGIIPVAGKANSEELRNELIATTSYPQIQGGR